MNWDRFLYKLSSNITYTKTLNSLDDRKDENYEENKRNNQINKSIPKKTGTRIYERADKGRKELTGTTAPMVINLAIQVTAMIENRLLIKKQYFLQHR